MRLNQWLNTVINIYIINKRWWLGWLVGDHSLLSEFEPYGIKFTNVCVVITVAMVMLLSDFGPYGIMFMTMCLLLFIFPSFLTSNLFVT
jgi:hypothetical protein